VQRNYRERLREVHPDHGAEVAGAAQRIAELSEARRILIGR
jgi:curved DNA-binding protein CbpA